MTKNRIYVGIVALLLTVLGMVQLMLHRKPQGPALDETRNNAAYASEHNNHKPIGIYKGPDGTYGYGPMDMSPASGWKLVEVIQR